MVKKTTEVVPNTGDKETQAITDEDLAAMGIGEDATYIPLDMDILKKLGEAAAETQAEFRKQATGANLSPQDYEFIRDLRVTQDYTWRAVAKACYDRDSIREAMGPWEPPSNQLMGMELCDIAAQFFGEHGGEEPWN
jgi:hypothetical protein